MNEPQNLPPVDSLSFEQARQELIGVVKTLEGDQAPLEQTMELWERGEALANHCQHILDQAAGRINAAQAASGVNNAAGGGENTATN